LWDDVGDGNIGSILDERKRLLDIVLLMLGIRSAGASAKHAGTIVRP